MVRSFSQEVGATDVLGSGVWAGEKNPARARHHLWGAGKSAPPARRSARRWLCHGGMPEQPRYPLAARSWRGRPAPDSRAECRVAATVARGRRDRDRRPRNRHETSRLGGAKAPLLLSPRQSAPLALAKEKRKAPAIRTEILIVIEVFFKN